MQLNPGDVEVSAPKGIGAFSVATNRYIKYWQAMAHSADKNLFVGHDVVLTVFTDQIEKVRGIEGDLERIRVNPVKIRDLKWPLAPLSKFQLFTNHKSEFDQPVLMHLDADTIVAPGAGADLEPTTWNGGVALVRHPGFRRPCSWRRLNLYLSYPDLLLRDFYRVAREGGLGTWETNTDSTAFVPRNKRVNYICGATWFAVAEYMQDLCEELSQHVARDLQRGVVARFHDESHLNWFRANRSCSVLESDYCFVRNARNLADLTPRIFAVEKYDDRTR